MKTTKFIIGSVSFCCNLLLVLTATMAPSVGPSFAAICGFAAMLVAAFLIIESMRNTH